MKYIVLCLLFCLGCSQHKLYVIGAAEDQFDQLQNNLKNSGIKVIKQNNLTSEFEQLTLVSAIAFPIGTVEAALDQVVYTSLAQSGNQFYTHSAGLYYPTYKPKIIDIFTNSCNQHLITFTTFEGNLFLLTVEQFIDAGRASEYVTVAEYQGTFKVTDKTMNAYNNKELVFSASEYFETSVQADSLQFVSTKIPQIIGVCKIVKRKNHS